MAIRNVHVRQLTDVFGVRTAVRQGCSLLPLLSLLAIDLNGSEAERNPVDSLETVGPPRLCRRSDSLPHPTTD
ncbi:hypothetical protein DPMN_013325 [Dreissena polymorpha]|uniref:Reverse transcriptase n=1 Tax=Dreissena polymorpha TaxID=45954 RepID=A0A9D4N9Q0_DREPO|nr:hypothetical protein DPMN_013325 [Dreissena polymorpha]